MTVTDLSPGTPSQSAPVQSGPAQSAPAQSGPAQSGPAQSGPAQSGPAQSGPAQSGSAPSTAPRGTTSPASAAPLDAGTLRAAFGTFPTGVVAVAGQVEGQLVGIAASSFTSVSLDPPLVQVNVASTSNTWPLLRSAGQVGISVLAEHHDLLCRQLAGPAESRFRGIGLTLDADGAVLLDDAVTGFTARIHREIEAGDHVVVLLELTGVVEGRSSEPLVFHRSSFARLHRDDLDPSRLAGRINGEPVA